MFLFVNFIDHVPVGVKIQITVAEGTKKFLKSVCNKTPYTHYLRLDSLMVLSTFITLPVNNAVYAIQSPYYLQVYKAHILTSRIV
jgi:hypothetical protein